jgi:hypothetical protein
MAAFSFPGVKAIADAYRKTAQDKMLQGYPGRNPNKPIKPIIGKGENAGNLYRRIGSYNTAANMATMRSTKLGNKEELSNITVSLNFAPPGATYGKWVEWGNGTQSGYGVPRPFAADAGKDPELKRAVDAAMLGNNGLINRYAKAIQADIEAEMEALGFTKS